MLDNIETWVGIAASLGFVAAFAAFFRRVLNRHRWRVFSSLVDRWARTEVTAVKPDADLLEAYLTVWLFEAGYTPQESMKLMDFAVLTAVAKVDFITRYREET